MGSGPQNISRRLKRRWKQCEILESPVCRCGCWIRFPHHCRLPDRGTLGILIRLISMAGVKSGGCLLGEGSYRQLGRRSRPSLFLSPQTSNPIRPCKAAYKSRPAQRRRPSHSLPRSSFQVRADLSGRSGPYRRLASISGQLR